MLKVFRQPRFDSGQDLIELVPSFLPFFVSRRAVLDGWGERGWFLLGWGGKLVG